MILDALQKTYDENRRKNPLFIRNLLKEQLQYYLLNFVYNSVYAETFLFKGGTCLRFCFGLPRLSEDLDFDVNEYSRFDRNQFINDLKAYFKNTLFFTDFEVSVSGINKIIYIKFPVLGTLGYPVNPAKPSENSLNIRIDLAPISGKAFAKEISLKSTADFSFLIRRYSLPDLYAGKIAAVLTRQRMEGTVKTPRFKGRDYFDIWWLKEKNIRWNFAYLKSLVNVSSEQEIIETLNIKLQEASKRKQELKNDLLPFFENPRFVEDVVNNLGSLTFP